jgi:hypothetical protein
MPDFGLPFSPTGSLRGVRRRTNRSNVIPMLGGGETTQRTLYVGDGPDSTGSLTVRVGGVK